MSPFSVSRFPDLSNNFPCFPFLSSYLLLTLPPLSLSSPLFLWLSPLCLISPLHSVPFTLSILFSLFFCLLSILHFPSSLLPCLPSTFSRLFLFLFSLISSLPSSLSLSQIPSLSHYPCSPLSSSLAIPHLPPLSPLSLSSFPLFRPLVIIPHAGVIFPSLSARSSPSFHPPLKARSNAVPATKRS